VWVKAWRAVLGALDEQQALDWEERFTDASLSPAKKDHPGISGIAARILGKK
jgi:hypothetical protein